jgi:O-antigen/teichoic acid export membrane protein
MELMRKLRASTLAQNTGWMFGGFGLQIAIQATYFVLIARALGAGQYGAFVAVTALVSIAAPFSGLGSANLLVKNVARNRSVLPAYWGNGMLMICASGTALLAIVLGVARLLLPGSVTLAIVLSIGVADLVLVKLADLAAVGFQAIEKMGHSAQLQVLTSLFRLAGIIVLRLFMPHPTAASWAVVYLAATALTAAIALTTTWVRIGAPQVELHRFGPEFIEGFYFSTSLSAQTIYNDIDKTMLARMVTLDAAGIYAAAYRVIDVAFTPVRSLLNAAYPRFFRHGAKGIDVSLSFSVRLIRPTAVYSLVAAAAMLAGAPLLPRILGPQFAATAEALRWLSLLPLLKSLHYFMGEALTGAGYQGLRTIMHVAVAVFNVLINLWIIPSYGWRGAAWSSLASDGLLAVLMCAAVLVRSRLDRGRRCGEQECLER